MSIDEPEIPDDELLAAELAFGLLEPGEQDAAEARERADSRFAVLVRRWREHLASLLDHEIVAGEGPGAAVWTAIAEAVPRQEADAMPALRRSLTRWRAVAAGLGAIAAALLALLASRATELRSTGAANPRVIVLLASGTAAPTGAVSYDPETHRLSARLGGLHDRARVPELWVLAPGRKPRSLGVVGLHDVTSRIADRSAIPLLADGATLAVSLEPGGGSPTGQPTGPVILSGQIS